MYLLSRVNHTFLPTPQYNQFEYTDKPLVSTENINILSEKWHEFHKETESWGAWELKDLQQEMDSEIQYKNEVEKIDSDTRVSPLGLFLLAKQYKEACEIICNNFPDQHPSLPNTELYKVRLYLIGHGFELLFKGVLLAKGVELSVLKKEYGHDLKKLMNSTIKNAGFSLSDRAKKLVLALNLDYAEKELEYHKTGSKQYPLVSELLEEAGVLFLYVENEFRTKRLQQK